MKRATDDALLRTIERLEQVLAAEALGREQAWAEGVDCALTDVERVLQHQAEEAGSPNGPFGEVDLTRPTLVRRVAELRRELLEELGETHTLRAEVRDAAEAFRERPSEGSAPGAPPEPAGRGSIPDFGALRQRLEQLVASLREYREGQAEVVLESVTTDLGAGD